MDYNQLREILVNTEALYSIWQATGMDEKEFILANGGLIKETEKTRLQKEQTKARQKRFIEKQKAEGRRTLTAIVSGSSYDKLTRLRDKAIQAGEKKSLGEVLDGLLSESSPCQASPPPEIIEETQNEIPAAEPVPEPPTGNDTQPDIIALMSKYRADGMQWPAIAERLNSQGIKTARGGAWTGPNAQAFYSRNK